MSHTPSSGPAHVLDHQPSPHRAPGGWRPCVVAPLLKRGQPLSDFNPAIHTGLIHMRLTHCPGFSTRPPCTPLQLKFVPNYDYMDEYKKGDHL